MSSNEESSFKNRHIKVGNNSARIRWGLGRALGHRQELNTQLEGDHEREAFSELASTLLNHLTYAHDETFQSHKFTMPDEWIFKNPHGHDVNNFKSRQVIQSGGTNYWPLSMLAPSYRAVLKPNEIGEKYLLQDRFLTAKPVSMFVVPFIRLAGKYPRIISHIKEYDSLPNSDDNEITAQNKFWSLFHKKYNQFMLLHPFEENNKTQFIINYFATQDRHENTGNILARRSTGNSVVLSFDEYAGAKRIFNLLNTNNPAPSLNDVVKILLSKQWLSDKKAIRSAQNIDALNLLPNSDDYFTLEPSRENYRAMPPEFAKHDDRLHLPSRYKIIPKAQPFDSRYDPFDVEPEYRETIALDLAEKL